MKPIEIRNTGLVAAYWRLTHCQIDHAAGIAEFRLHGWPSGGARRRQGAAARHRLSRASAEELGLPDLHAVTSAALYAAARARPAEDGTVWFADADDA